MHRREDSLINDYFTGDMLNELRCSKCEYRKYSFDKFGEICVDFTEQKVPQYNYSMTRRALQSEKDKQQPPRDLEDLIQDFFREETIEGFKCTKCNRTCTHYKKCRIWTYPRTLFIYLKRFVYFPEPKKINDRVILNSAQIDLGPYKPKIKKPNSGRYPVEIKTLAHKYQGNYQLNGYIDHQGQMSIIN